MRGWHSSLQCREAVIYCLQAPAGKIKASSSLPFRGTWWLDISQGIAQVKAQPGWAGVHTGPQMAGAGLLLHRPEVSPVWQRPENKARQLVCGSNSGTGRFNVNRIYCHGPREEPGAQGHVGLAGPLTGNS